jgi:alcohol dehydrogenase class IV
MNFSAYSPTEIYSGAGCVLSFNRFSTLGSRCAIITGRNMHNHNSALLDVQAALDNEHIQYSTIAEAENNPSVKSIFDIASLVKAFNADFIIGIGGGSSMDTAKAVSIVAANDDLNEGTVFSVSYDAPAVPLVLVGTTAGTGSEVMPSAVLTVDGEIPIKKSLKTRNSYAKYALCDFKYSSSMPDSITVSTALDTVCHAIEAIYSKKGGEFAKVYGISALKYSFKRILEFVDGERTDRLREDLYYGSILGGLAINNGGTSFPHSLGYMLTTMHGINHGFACSVFIGDFLNRVSKIEDVSAILGVCNVESVKDFSNAVDFIMTGFCKRPCIDKDALEKYSALAMKMNVNNNHLNITFDDCLDIYLHNCRG